MVCLFEIKRCEGALDTLVPLLYYPDWYNGQCLGAALRQWLITSSTGRIVQRLEREKAAIVFGIFGGTSVKDANYLSGQLAIIKQVITLSYLIYYQIPISRS